MRLLPGRIHEVQLDEQGNLTAWIACPPAAIPAAGQYTLADVPGSDNPLAIPLFASAVTPAGFRLAPPIPDNWQPGTALVLTGPLGNGFSLPGSIARLGLVSLGATAARLLSLQALVSQKGGAVALFTDAALPSLPPDVEVYPLAGLPENTGWADFLALDLPLERLPSLRAILGLGSQEQLPCPAQALIYTAMPCAGLAECGACAVPARRGWKLACKDGPVFDMRELAW